jgi:hypothetical protein
MITAFFSRVRALVLLAPFLYAGIIVYLSYHREAIWLSILPSKTEPGEFELEYRVEHPRWWRVNRYSFEEHADRLAEKLAEELVLLWNQQK